LKLTEIQHLLAIFPIRPEADKGRIRVDPEDPDDPEFPDVLEFRNHPSIRSLLFVPKILFFLF